MHYVGHLSDAKIYHNGDIVTSGDKQYVWMDGTFLELGGMTIEPDRRPAEWWAPRTEYASDYYWMRSTFERTFDGTKYEPNYAWFTPYDWPSKPLWTKVGTIKEEELNEGDTTALDEFLNEFRVVDSA